MIKVKFKGRKIVVCARAGGANTTPFMATHFAKQNTKFGGGGKRGRAKIPFPQPPSFLPARAFRFCARSAQSFRVFVKKCSNFVQKTPPIFTLKGKDFLLAEGVGFEPTVSCPTVVFKTTSFVRSDTPPKQKSAITNL